MRVLFPDHFARFLPVHFRVVLAQSTALLALPALRCPPQVPGTNPEVEDAAAYAVEQLSQQSNSLYPFTLRKVCVRGW